MKLTVTRLDQGKYKTVVRRDDGVSYRLKGVAHVRDPTRPSPIFWSRRTLRLHRGFWGNVADGAVFKTMSYIGGRRKPRATERSESLLKINTAPLNEAEAVVRIFNDAIEQGYQENSPVLRERLRSRLARPGLEFRTSVR